MPLKFGDFDCTFMFGDNTVSKIYFGDDLVFENYQPVSGETWVFNDGNLSDYEFKDFTVNFTCNGVRYTRMHNADPDYGDWWFSGNGHDVDVSGLNYYGPYILDEYRTIVLDNPAEGELLSWLNVNATKLQ